MSINITADWFTRRRIVSHVPISVSVLQDTDFWIRNMVVAQFEADLISHHVDNATQTATTQVPATWWDHFKADAIQWGNPLFDPSKVRYRTITLQVDYELWVTFPHATIAYPDILGMPIYRLEHVVVDAPQARQW